MTDDMTPRERRAQRASASKSKTLAPKVNWGKVVPPLLIIALLGLVFFMVFAGGGKGDEKCPSINGAPPHCHSSLHMWVELGDGEWDRINWASSKFVLTNDRDSTRSYPEGLFPLRHHLHAGTSKEEVHWEPPPSGKIEMRDFLGVGRIKMSSTSFTTDGPHEETGQGYAFIANETVDIKVYEAMGFEDNWQEISVSNFLSTPPTDGLKHLVVVGSPTPAKLAELQAGVPVPPSSFVANGVGGAPPGHGMQG